MFMRGFGMRKGKKETSWAGGREIARKKKLARMGGSEIPLTKD